MYKVLYCFEYYDTLIYSQRFVTNEVLLNVVKRRRDLIFCVGEIFIERERERERERECVLKSFMF